MTLSQLQGLNRVESDGKIFMNCNHVSWR